MFNNAGGTICLNVYWSGMYDNYGIHRINIYKNGEFFTFRVPDRKNYASARSSYPNNFYDLTYTKDTTETVTYEFEPIDCAGNVGERTTLVVEPGSVPNGVKLGSPYKGPKEPEPEKSEAPSEEESEFSESAVTSEAVSQPETEPSASRRGLVIGICCGAAAVAAVIVLSVLAVVPALQPLLQAEDLPLQLAGLGLGLGGLVQIALDLAAQLLRRGLLLEELVRDVGGGEDGGVRPPHPGAGEDGLHLLADVAAHPLHVGGGLLRHEGVILPADADDDTVFHALLLLLLKGCFRDMPGGFRWISIVLSGQGQIRFFEAETTAGSVLRAAGRSPGGFADWLGCGDAPEKLRRTFR